MLTCKRLFEGTMVMSSEENTLPSVAIVVFDKFSPFHLSVPSLIFGNTEIHDKPMFNMQLVAGEDGPITSDIGMEVKPQEGIKELVNYDFIIIPYWRNIEEKPSQELLTALVSAYENGATLIGLCLGGYVLAHTGLLNNKASAMHWKFERDFSTRFPLVKLDNNALYIEDDRLITSAGIAANIDCSLHVFRKCYGSKATNTIARRLVIPPHREGGQAQYIDRPIPINTADFRINTLLEKMRKNLSCSYKLDELAESVMMTRRTFTRKFNSATGMSVGQWLTAERLHQAQELLETTGLTIESVSDKLGFSSVIVFREQFKKRFHVTPNEWRKTFRLND